MRRSWFVRPVVITAFAVGVFALFAQVAHARVDVTPLACASDKKTLEVAEEAYYALHSEYARESTLVTADFLRRASTMHNVKVLAGGADFRIVPTKRGGCS